MYRSNVSAPSWFLRLQTGIIQRAGSGDSIRHAGNDQVVWYLPIPTIAGEAKFTRQDQKTRFELHDGDHIVRTVNSNIF